MNNILTKFIDKVTIENENNPNSCWLWKGAVNDKGYGSISVNGKLVKVHRFSFEIFKGELSKNLEIDHLCRKRNCVNPSHLEQVSHKINVVRGNVGQNQTDKIKCPRGHEYTGTNNRGQRICRICMNEKQNIRRKLYGRSDRKKMGVSIF